MAGSSTAEVGDAAPATLLRRRFAGDAAAAAAAAALADDPRRAAEFARRVGRLPLTLFEVRYWLPDDHAMTHPT